MERLEVYTRKGDQELTPDLVLALYMLCGKIQLSPRNISFQPSNDDHAPHTIVMNPPDSASVIFNDKEEPSLAKRVWEYLGTPVEYDGLIQDFSKAATQTLVTKMITKSNSREDALDHLFVFLDALKETQNAVLTELKDQDTEFEQDFKAAGGKIETLTDDGREFKIASYTGKFRPQTRAWLFVRIGVHYLVYKSGPNMGVLRNKDQQRCPCPSLLDLDGYVQNAVSEEEFIGAGNEPGWFFFEDLAGRGTESRPVSTPSQLSLDNFLRLLEEFIEY